MAEGLPADVVARSEAYGRRSPTHVLAWSRDDGGAVVENMGFPLEYELTPGAGALGADQPDPAAAVAAVAELGQQPHLRHADGHDLRPAAAARLQRGQGLATSTRRPEVYETVKNLDARSRRAIARFWSDDPMLSPTPPGHWISIALQILERDKRRSRARASMFWRASASAVADAFIGCWDAKFQYDLVRPVTYIRRLIDPKWEPLLITPPFPEYPSGHSTQSGAAAAVLTAALRREFRLRGRDARRPTASSRAPSRASGRRPTKPASRGCMAASISAPRSSDGLEQGRCIGAYANALKTRR